MSEQESRRRRRQSGAPQGFGVILLIICAVSASWMIYSMFRIDVGTGQMAILISRTGQDLKNGDEVAPGPDYKGIQKQVLPEGRHFYNPYFWDWKVVDQVVIPEGKLGVKISLTGEDLGYGEFLSRIDEQGNPLTKGIMPGILNPGRYPLNPYLYEIELHDPVTVEAGFKGVVTHLAGPMPKRPNTLVVDPGERGVQSATRDPGTYYINPYEERINLVDCRSQRFNLSQGGEMGFPSKDGFWVSLDGIIEFRVNPEKAAEIYVLYNESANGEAINEEIIDKIIMPNARSFCRIQGSSSLGREFIEGETRSKFQEDFQLAMKHACEPLGIDIIQALITQIQPPQQIASPVRDREIAKQEELQYKQQILQQESEQKLAVEKAMVLQKKALIEAQQEVVALTTQAMQDQEVALTKANQELKVAELKLEAAKDEAAAIEARGKATADIIRFENTAEAAGWKKAVESYQGNGMQYAQYIMFTKLASAYQSIMVNTADSPMMKVFDAFETGSDSPVQPPRSSVAEEADPSLKTQETSTGTRP